MKLLIQPEDGVTPITEAIAHAKKSIEIAIFRCDHPEIQRALMDAVKRGVAVQALIACTNRGGDQRLRGLEMQLLEAGAIVSRTNNDLARYHAKYLIIDRKRLLLLGFNFTRADLHLTRSFGISSTQPKLVKEALKLFSADSLRQEYTSGWHGLAVSPINARERMADFLNAAKDQLMIYDLEVSDPAMLAILKAQCEAGIKIRVIGRVKAKNLSFEVRASHPLRLHARAIVRDSGAVFIGSQSLRRLELDSRREVGVFLKDSILASHVAKVFEADWSSAKAEEIPASKVAKKVAKAIAKEMGPIMPVLEEVAAKTNGKLAVDADDMESAVKDAVKSAIRDAVHEVVASRSSTNSNSGGKET